MSDGFSDQWLELRSSADRTARSVRLERQVRRWALRLHRHHSARPLRIIDFGCGNGVNLRHLAGLLGPRQQWRLLDHDPALLSAAATRIRQWAAERGLDAIDDSMDRLMLSDGYRHLNICLEQCDLRTLPDLGVADLVTGSALLDLTSAEWLRQLARYCDRRGAALLFTLSYDGKTDWQPPEPFDDEMIGYFNRHQQSDKSFGRALGPHAADYLIGRLRRLGYRVAVDSSPWRLTPDDRAMQQALIDGFRHTGLALDPDRQSLIDDWTERRRNAIDRTRLRIGHLDLFAWRE